MMLSICDTSFSVTVSLLLAVLVVLAANQPTPLTFSSLISFARKLFSVFAIIVSLRSAIMSAVCMFILLKSDISLTLFASVSLPKPKFSLFPEVSLPGLAILPMTKSTALLTLSETIG